jgi:hypothetical protein
MLYQLSYFRKNTLFYELSPILAMPNSEKIVGSDGFEPPKAKAS